MNLNDMQVREEPTVDELQEWFGIGPKVKELQARESYLREKIVAFYFNGQVQEGVNRIDAPFDPSWDIEVTGKLTRDIDPAALDSYRDELINACIDVQSLLNYKASLNTKAYKNLPEEQRQVFDNVLIIKQGKPSLKFAPKKAKD